ncbi:hypothetical protein [Streptomyces chrestomyceticus]|nr:hypothetical protein [Streptomyces chrestomyceticus]
MEGCTDAAALTREIQLLGYRGNVNTVRRHAAADALGDQDS